MSVLRREDVVILDSRLTLSRTPSLCLSSAPAYDFIIPRQWLLKMSQICKMKATRSRNEGQEAAKGSPFSQLLAVVLAQYMFGTRHIASDQATEN